MGFWDGSGIGWIICKQSAANSGQTTTPTPRHSIFLQAGCSSWRPTNSIKALKANSVNTKWQINWLFSSSIRECCVGAFLARSSWRRGEPCTIQFTLHYNVQTISLNSHTHTHTHTHLTALCPGLPRWTGTTKVKPIWILLKQETVSGSGNKWAICKSAPRSRQITMPAPHYSLNSITWKTWCPSQDTQADRGRRSPFL